MNKSLLLKQAYDACIEFTRRHQENFPVMQYLLTKQEREHVAAIYTFARTADDIADEGSLTFAERKIQLQAIKERLHDCYTGKPSQPLFIALQDTIADCEIPLDLLDSLLEAFNLDLTVHRYATLQELKHNYCRLSANPIGRLMLLIFKQDYNHWSTYSDHICTGLQLVNFWQDISIDINKSRVYIPEADLRDHGINSQDIINRKFSPAFVEVLGDLLSKTAAEFEAGKTILKIPNKRLGYLVKASYFNGHALLKKIQCHADKVLYAKIKLSPLERFSTLVKILSSSIGNKQLKFRQPPSKTRR